MDTNQILEQWQHEVKWLWLNFRLAEEMPREYIRQAIEDCKLPKTRFILDDKLRRAMNLR